MTLLIYLFLVDLIVMFQPPRSSVDISFWEALHHLKLDKLKLESPFINVSAVITASNSRTNGGGGSLRVDGHSFDEKRVSSSSW